MPNNDEQLAMQLNAPIPGESLTATPGGMPWEKPAKFSDPEDAVEYVVNQLQIPDNEVRAASLMDAGVPIDGMVKTIALSGFTEGLWTPDVAELIQPAIGVALLALADNLGVKPTITMGTKEDDNNYYEIRKALRPDTLAPKKKAAPKMDDDLVSLAEEKMGEGGEGSGPPDDLFGGFMAMGGQ